LNKRRQAAADMNTHALSGQASRDWPMTQAIWFRFRLALNQYRPWLCLSLVVAGACGPGSKDRDAQDQVPAAPAAVTARPTDTVSGASRLQWTLANLEETLRKSGLNPVRRGRVAQPFFGGEGILYQIGLAELQVYLYADAGAVARDTDPLDTTRVAPPTMQVSWRMPPALIVDNNMAAILLTRDRALRQKIRAAIKKGHRD
jgi:hypothetical protein